MNTFAKTSLAVALGAAVLASSVSACSARNWRPYAAGAAGFAVGAAIGAAAANANASYYGPGYNRGYAYDGYAYDNSYPVETYPTYYNQGFRRCTVDEGYGRRSSCDN